MSLSGAYFCICERRQILKKLKQKSLAVLADGLERHEKGTLRNSDYTNLQTFARDFLNEPDKKQRRKLSAEFQKRHMELYQFLKENAELISAQTETARIIHATVNGETVETETKQLTNLFEMLEESLHDV